MSSTYYFVAYGGHLHLVSLKELKADKMHECNILKYNWLDGDWKMMNSLEGGILFLGKPSFGVLAGEQTILIADKVYYFSSQTSMPKFLVYGPTRIEERVSFLGNKHTIICSYHDKELIGESMFDFHVSQAYKDLDFMSNKSILNC